MTREASAAMVALVEALSVASYAAGHAAGCDEYTADEERVASEAVDAPEDALLAAIAAQEAATEAAQAEVARLRAAITHIADACVVAMRLAAAVGLDAGAMPEIERDLRAALKETP